MYRSTFFLTSALDGGEYSASHPGLLNPGTHWTGDWVDPRVALDDAEKILRTNGTQLRPLSPPDRSQSLYRLSHPRPNDARLPAEFKRTLQFRGPELRCSTTKYPRRDRTADGERKNESKEVKCCCLCVCRNPPTLRACAAECLATSIPQHCFDHGPQAPYVCISVSLVTDLIV
jgi:hypothetical protein